VSDVLLPYERQLGESSKAFAAFCIYRDRGPGRTLLEACRQFYGKPTANLRQLETWSTRWNWVSRVKAWDDELDRVNRESQAKARQDMAQRHAQAAMGLQEKAIRRLMSMQSAELAPGDVLRYLIEAAKLERLARGEPEAIHEERQKVSGHHEINLFAHIEQLAAAFRPFLRSGLEDGGLPADRGAESVYPSQADAETETGPAA
jgi:hypothetical protein